MVSLAATIAAFALAYVALECYQQLIGYTCFRTQ